MNPKPNHEHLSAWLDGELSDAEAAELEAELERDPALRAELDALEAVVQFVRREGPAQAPLDFHRQVMARIEEEFPEHSTASSWAWLRRPWGIPLEGWVLAMAAAAVLILLVPDWSSGPEPTGGEKELSPAAFELPAPVAKDKTQPAEPVTSKDAAVEVIGRATTDPDPRPEDPKLEKGPRKGTGDKLTEGKVLPAPVPVPGGVDSLSTEVVEKLPEPSGTAETEPTVPQPLEPDMAVRYVVSSKDPEMKREILSIAARYGTPTDIYGQEVKSGAMTSGVEELLVTVPQKQLTQFTQELARNGYKVDPVSSDKLLAGDTIEVRVILALDAGTPNADEAEPPNARKARQVETSEAW